MTEVTQRHVDIARATAHSPGLRWLHDLIGADEVESIAYVALAELASSHDPDRGPFAGYMATFLRHAIVQRAGLHYEHGCALRRPDDGWPCGRPDARDCSERHVSSPLHGDAPVSDDSDEPLWSYVVGAPRGSRQAGLRCLPERTDTLYGADPLDVVIALETIRERGRAGVMPEDLTPEARAEMRPRSPRIGRPPAGQGLSDAHREQIAQEYAAGDSLRTLAGRWGISTAQVARIRDAAGVASHPVGQPQAA